MKGPWLAATESGEAARAASPELPRLSRYPTRTVPAVLSRARSRHRRPTAASGPLSCGVAAFVVAVRTPRGDLHCAQIFRRPLQLVGSRPRWAR
jgi:hypothetical protein